MNITKLWHNKNLSFFILLLLCCCKSNSAFTQLRIAENIKIPDTIFYPLNDGRELIEIDFESAWQREVDWHEHTQPRGMSWSQLIPIPERNVLLIRNREKIVTQVFNSHQPIGLWNTIFNNKKKQVSSSKKDQEFYEPLYFKQHSYLGNERVRTRLKNGCYLVNMVMPDSMNTNHLVDGKHLGLIDPSGKFIFPIVYDYIELVGSDYLVKKDAKIGVINGNNEIVVPLRYETASVKQDGSIVLGSKGKVRKIYQSANRKLSTLNDYDWIDENRLDDRISPAKSDLIMVWKNGNYGFINRNFEVVIPAIYDFTGYANPEGLIRVCHNKKWGFLNHKGEVIVPIVYDDAIEFYEGKSNVRKSDSLFCIDKMGQRTTGCNETYAKWNITEGGGYSQYIKGRRIVTRSYQKGVINDAGELVCPIIYNHLVGIESNTSEYRWSKFYYKAAIGTRWGIIDKNGNAMVPFIYDQIDDFKGGMELFTVKRNNLYGLINNQFKVVIPCEYEGIDFITCKDKYWFLEKGKWGLMNKDLKVIIEPMYDSHDWMYHGKINVQINKRYGMIDSTGRMIIPVKYESLGSQFYNGLVLASVNKKWGYLDSLHQVIIPMEYDDARHFYKNIAGVKKGKKYFFINRKNEVINDAIYDFIDHDWSWNGMIKVMNKGKVGLVNEAGKEIIPCEYDDLIGYSTDKGFYFLKNKQPVWIKL